jgi:hypothetical protein
MGFENDPLHPMSPLKAKKRGFFSFVIVKQKCLPAFDVVT